MSTQEHSSDQLAEYFLRIMFAPLLPEDYPLPLNTEDWLVLGDWWEERGDFEKAEQCREQSTIAPEQLELFQAAKTAYDSAKTLVEKFKGYTRTDFS